jgi:hypothetical protein
MSLPWYRLVPTNLDVRMKMMLLSALLLIVGNARFFFTCNIDRFTGCRPLQTAWALALKEIGCDVFNKMNDVHNMRFITREREKQPSLRLP